MISGILINPPMLGAIARTFQGTAVWLLPHFNTNVNTTLWDKQYFLKINQARYVVLAYNANNQ